MNPPAQDVTMAKAMSHPVRVSALRILNERVASPSEIARQLELPVANVAYHVNALLRLGCVEEVDTRPVRGALEHFYRATRTDLTELESMRALPESVRHGVIAQMVTNAVGDVHQALATGTAEARADTHFTHTPMTLDAEAWDRVYAILRTAWDDVDREHEAAKERVRAGADPLPARMSIMLYPAAPSA